MNEEFEDNYQMIECPFCGEVFDEDEVEGMGKCPQCGEYIAQAQQPITKNKRFASLSQIAQAQLRLFSEHYIQFSGKIAKGVQNGK